MAEQSNGEHRAVVTVDVFFDELRSPHHRRNRERQVHGRTEAHLDLDTCTDVRFGAHQLVEGAQAWAGGRARNGVFLFIMTR